MGVMGIMRIMGIMRDEERIGRLVSLRRLRSNP